MEKSESIKELATALAKAQGEIKGALKDSANPFFKSKYADLASVVEAIRAAFSEAGLSYVQVIHDSDKDQVSVETVLLHASGEWLSCGTLSVPVAKADAQGFGSALTYARRYSLSAAAGVAPEDDDGNAAAKAAPRVVQKALPDDAGSVKTVSQNSWDELPPEEQAEVQHIVDCVVAEHDKGPAASLALLRNETADWQNEKMKAAIPCRIPKEIKTAWNALEKQRKAA